MHSERMGVLQSEVRLSRRIIAPRQVDHSFNFHITENAMMIGIAVTCKPTEEKENVSNSDALIAQMTLGSVALSEMPFSQSVLSLNKHRVVMAKAVWPDPSSARSCYVIT